jgi:very-short-patch-repair endonuclease
VRARAGRLHRIHQGVYAVGHSGLAQEGRWMAAVLACGGRTAVDGGNEKTALDRWGAALSHRSAAALWGLLPPTDFGPVDVSVAADSGRRRRQGIRLHRCLALSPASVTLNKGIPVTSAARTIVDLRRCASMKSRQGTVSQAELRRAIRQADLLGLQIGSEVNRDRTRSELEFLFLRLCRQHSLTMPEVNVRLGSLTVDFLWRGQRLIVETDGYRYHRGRASFEHDRNRDLTLKTMNYEVIRLSHAQIVDNPERIVRVLRASLAPSSPHGGGSRHAAA